MKFKQLTLLAEDDFMAGMEEFEQEARLVYNVTIEKSERHTFPVTVYVYSSNLHNARELMGAESAAKLIKNGKITLRGTRGSKGLITFNRDAAKKMIEDAQIYAIKHGERFQIYGKLE